MFRGFLIPPTSCVYVDMLTLFYMKQLQHVFQIITDRFCPSSVCLYHEAAAVYKTTISFQHTCSYNTRLLLV